MSTRFLVAILTSSRAQLARLCYDTIQAQREHALDFDVVFVLNSVNPRYRDELEQAVQDTGAEIVVTESNGRPGKGHNSVLQLFAERVEYDYLIPIDGDDLLYPTAFHQIEKLVQHQPHYVGLQTNDGLTQKPTESANVVIRDDWRLVSWFDRCENWWMQYPIRSPYVEAPEVWVTPSRPILIHRAALAHLPLKSYGEEYRLFDDLLHFLNACEAYYRRPKEFRLGFTSNTYLYIHNDVNAHSVSNRAIDYASEAAIFRKDTENKFASIREWNLKDLPHFKITNPQWFTTEDKIAFAKQCVERIEAIA